MDTALQIPRGGHLVGEDRQLEQRDIVLEVICTEPEGTVVRCVTPAKISLDSLRFYYERLKEFDMLFNTYVKNDFASFMSMFVSEEDGSYYSTGLMWDVDDVGLLRLTDIFPAISADAHFTFWDKRLRGREELVRAMLSFVFEKYAFHRITCKIPLFSKPAMKFVERVGFVKEGRARQAVLYEDEWFDLNLYGILREEVLYVTR
jgi:RimJ/RimL family protein N-acetyltransferase